MRTGQFNSVDVKAKRGDGSIGDFCGDQQGSRVTNAEGRIIGFSGTIQVISARKSAEETLERLAYYDPLTGLANRALFHREINDVLTHCTQTGSRAALLLLDLDTSRRSMIRFGHAAGDELLARSRI